MIYTQLDSLLCVFHQLLLATISLMGSEKTSVLKKEISVISKKLLGLMIFMQLLRHYCVNEVPRVSVRISGQIATPLQLQLSYEFRNKNP